MQRRKSTIESLCYEAFRHFNAQTGSRGSVTEMIDMLWNSHWFDEFHLSDDFKYFTIKEYLEKTVVSHKVSVYKAGMEMIEKFGERFYGLCGDKGQFEHNLFFHDLSKFGTEEHGGYAFYDFEKKMDNYFGGFSFERAWHNHKMNNPHHPEYWWNVSREGEGEPIRIPKVFVAEMVADWMGAGKTYGSSMEVWLPGNLHKFRFHEETVVDLFKILMELEIGVKLELDVNQLMAV